MFINCITCDHEYQRLYFKKHLKTNLHKKKLKYICPSEMKDYYCSKCFMTHELNEIQKIKNGTYFSFHGCKECFDHIKKM